MMSGDKMKKILLALLVFVLTGCTAQYNLEIDDNSIKENVSIKILTSAVNESFLQDQVDKSKIVYADKLETYNTKFENDNENYNISFDYIHKTEDFTNSKFLNICYNSNKISVVEDKLIIKTSNQFNCINMDNDIHADKVEINITTKLKVTGNNADEVQGNKYIWNITSENYQNKPVQMEIKLPIKYEVTEGTKYISALVIGLLAMGILVFIIVKIKRKTNNSL